jgi:hypothetical protein
LGCSIFDESFSFDITGFFRDSKVLPLSGFFVGRDGVAWKPLFCLSKREGVLKYGFEL